MQNEAITEAAVSGLEASLISDEIMEDSEKVVETKAEVKDETPKKDYTRFGKDWQEVVNNILVGLVTEPAFYNRVLRDFAKKNLATSESGRKVMKSLLAGMAVYGKLTDNQFELGMKIFREHTNILFETYGTEFGRIEEDDDLPF